MEKLKLACSLYLSGFVDACCVHRAYFFCRRSQKIFLKTVQCFFLNGLIFLGIYFFIEKLVVPVVHWILTFPLGQEKKDGSPVMEKSLLFLCNALLVFPLYVVSYGASLRWYTDIAQEANVITMLETKSPDSKEKQQQAPMVKPTQNQGNQGNTGLDSILFNFGEQTYCMIMVLMFLVEAYAISWIPYIGQWLIMPLYMWLYAFYFFDYKWAYANWSLEKRLTFFETHWAFFAGFGSPCVLATFSLSTAVSNGVFAFLLPLFVLVAFGSYPEKVIAAAYNASGEGTQAKLPRVPIFYLPSVLMNKLLYIVGEMFFGAKQDL